MRHIELYVLTIFLLQSLIVIGQIDETPFDFYELNITKLNGKVKSIKCWEDYNSDSGIVHYHYSEYDFDLDGHTIVETNYTYPFSVKVKDLIFDTTITKKEYQGDFISRIYYDSKNTKIDSTLFFLSDDSLYYRQENYFGGKLSSYSNSISRKNMQLVKSKYYYSDSSKPILVKKWKSKDNNWIWVKQKKEGQWLFKTSKSALYLENKSLDIERLMKHNYGNNLHIYKGGHCVCFVYENGNFEIYKYDAQGHLIYSESISEVISTSYFRVVKDDGSQGKKRGVKKTVSEEISKTEYQYKTDDKGNPIVYQSFVDGDLSHIWHFEITYWE